MIILNSATSVLRARLAAAVTTAEPQFLFAYGDDGGSRTLGSNDGDLNGTTNVTLVDSPSASVSRVIRSGFICNKDTASATVIVEHYDGTNARQIVKVTLVAGATLNLSDAGFSVGTATGTVGDMLASVYDAAGVDEQLVGLTATQTLTNKDLSSSTNTFPSNLTKTIASGTGTLGTSAIASGASATVVTVSATGVATTDVIDWGFNGSPIAVTGYIPSSAGMLTIIGYPTAGNVNFVVTNNTAASITPGAITLNWRVLR